MRQKYNRCAHTLFGRIQGVQKRVVPTESAMVYSAARLMRRANVAL
ncbi:hypothetical protein SS05631_c06620 [Sinorhizobium sp. CCBAU 05631]|nr:hypothetical protein SS05631_c06620 [Sinorhizobium sp. CCBAU 05631]